MRLLDLFFRKQRRIEGMVRTYLDLWEECLTRFDRAFEAWLEQGLSEEFAYLVERTHRAESQADDQRRAIEYEMYAKALLPESRGDILGFLESIDTVPSTAETSLFIIAGERIEPPREVAADLGRLVNLSLESTGLLLALARQIFGGRSDFFPAIREIDDLESRCDHLERGLIAKIFSSETLAGVEQLKLRNLIVKLGDLSDGAQKVSDRILIMSLKRKI